MEESLLLTALKSLIAAGPVAMVLGLLAWKLWQRNEQLQGKLDRQHVKMLKLAVRVQRAVEALAGLEEPPEIEEDLEDVEEGEEG